MDLTPRRSQAHFGLIFSVFPKADILLGASNHLSLNTVSKSRIQIFVVFACRKLDGSVCKVLPYLLSAEVQVHR